MKIREFSQIDGRKLMDLYGESNAENADYFYPDAADKAAALTRIETDFLTYIRDKFLQDPSNRYMILAEDGVWVSALRLYALGAGEYYIEALETHPAFRRRGYGAALLGMVLEHLRAEGPFRVRDCVSKKNTASLRTHEKCGFIAADTVGHDLLDGSVDERCYTMEYRYPRETRERRDGMKKYDLAIFDLDGTILDTLADLAGSTNAALAACGYPTRTLDEVRRFVGNGVRKLIERAVPAGTGEADMERVFAAFKAHYAAHSMDKTRPYDGIPALLDGLRAAGLRLAVVSNKLDAAVGPLCEHFFPGRFDAAVGERPGVRKKPAPDTVDAVLQALGISRERAVYIGDSEVDIETARNAGMAELAVTWGFRDAAFLKEQGAARLVSSPAELYAILTGE